MTRVLAVVSQKGGVGKTTTAVNLAAAFAREGREVLLVEIDPQGAVLPSVGCEDTPPRHSLVDVLRDEQIPASSAVLPTPIEGISVVRSIHPDRDEELDLEQIALAHPMVLSEILDQMKNRFDIVILDGPPTLGPLTRMCLAAADGYIVPVQAEEYSYRTIERLLHVCDDVQQTLNPTLRCEGLLLTMVDLRTRMSVRVVNQLHENYGDKVLVSMVPRTVSVQEMPVKGRPTVVHAGSSRGGRAYTEVGTELLANFDSQPMSISPLLSDEDSVPATMVARSGEAAIEDTRSFADIGEETMISSFPSTHATGTAVHAQTHAHDDNDDLFEMRSDDENDFKLN